jgi:hypothetical protein
VGVGVLPSYTLCWMKTDDRLWKSVTTNQGHLLFYTSSYSTQVQSRKSRCSCACVCGVCVYGVWCVCVWCVCMVCGVCVWRVCVCV